MALDRPANPPDRPEVPDSADVPADPHGVANLTRAEAFKSHRYWSESRAFPESAGTTKNGGLPTANRLSG